MEQLLTGPTGVPLLQRTVAELIHELADVSFPRMGNEQVECLGGHPLDRLAVSSRKLPDEKVRLAENVFHPVPEGGR